MPTCCATLSVMLLRRIHRNALSWTNRQLIADDREPVKDFPTGWRTTQEGDTPIEKLLGPLEKIPYTKAEGDLDDFEFAVSAIAYSSKASAELWTVLFVGGFYNKYDEANYYNQLPPTRRRKVINTLKSAPSDLNEKRLKVEQLIDYYKANLDKRKGGLLK